MAQGDVQADLLRNVLRAKRSVVADAIEEVASRGLLDVLGQRRVRFHHELLRRTVADALSPLVRAEWHRRWALTLQRLDEVERSDPTVLAALAHHWFSAGDPDQAVPAAVAAGQAASAIGAATESAVHWHRALLHWHRAGDAEASTGISHENALIEGTTVLRLAGAYTELLEVLAAERARAHADPVLRLWLDPGLAATSSRLGNIQRQVVSREGLPTVLDLLAASRSGPWSARRCSGSGGTRTTPTGRSWSGSSISSTNRPTPRLSRATQSVSGCAAPASPSPTGTRTRRSK